MIRIARALFVTGAMAGATPAHAALVTTTFCIEHSTSFADAATGDNFTGSSVPAGGVHFSIVKESTGLTVNDVFLAETGSPGCVTLDGSGPGKDKLDSALAYTVKVHRDASVNGSSIVVNTASGGTFTAIPKTGLYPTSGHTYSYANGDTWTRTASGDAQNILTAASSALKGHNAGLSGETFTFRDGSCPGGANCFDDATEIIWIQNADRKFTIASMMGLAVANFANGHDDVLTDDSASLDGCVPGETATGLTKMNTKEYSSLAAYRGYGLFYAAAAFNLEGTDDDCEYESALEVDWNADGDKIDADEDQIFSCEDSPAPALGVNDEDYLDQFCPSLANRGTQYDWLRGLWDFRTDSANGGHSVNTMFGWFDGVNPDTWDPSGSDTSATIADPASQFVGEVGFSDWVAIGGANGLR